MFKKSASAFTALLVLAACASTQPRIIQATPDSPTVTVTAGMATQIELPDAEHVQSIAVGNPSLLSAEQNVGVVNLAAKEGAKGETNLIIRSRGEDGMAKVYQYHVMIQSP